MSEDNRWSTCRLQVSDRELKIRKNTKRTAAEIGVHVTSLFLYVQKRKNDRMSRDIADGIKIRH
jgi:hypothetical protein